MASKIVMHKWEEPESGSYAEVWDLSPPEWEQVQAAIAWVREYWEEKDGGEYGSTIVETEVIETRATGGECDGLEDALRRLALQVRYTTGEGLYEEECPIFEEAGIEQS